MGAGIMRVAPRTPSAYSSRAAGRPTAALAPERGAAWLAHQSGGLGVASSNLAAPTNQASVNK